MFLTVKDACTLHENALSINVGDQVEKLDELISSEGDGSAFFAKTHITQGMRTLIDAGIPRLAGQTNDAVFHLKQAMGGGKTHVLIAFGLLAKEPALRAKVCPEIHAGERFGAAKVAAFNGRNNPDQYFWGEIARQLGETQERSFRRYWESGPRAPDADAWGALFSGNDPILILLDEMPPYFQYYETQKVGSSTVADIVTRAFANMLVAASNRPNVCVVVSDLEASYAGGQRLIQSALNDARGEVGRMERAITPVDLASNEIYAILRKRLFTKWGDAEVINDVAAKYGEALASAARAKVASRSAESVADEIAETYPFHPRLKNLIALFKENEEFRQTRGLMELVSRLLKSVWERPTNDVHLIGAQHFDLSISEVRTKLADISVMQDVIAKDLWDSAFSAHAQIVDAERGGDAAAQVASLLLTASLSTAVNAVKGLARDEMVECLVTPLRPPSEFLAAFDEIEERAWYLHHTPDERFYFDKIQNLTKLLQDRAKSAPEAQIEEFIKRYLAEKYKAVSKRAYSKVAALPTLEEAAALVQSERALLIMNPDAVSGTETLNTFFLGLTRKNNLLVLTGDRTRMASLEQSARQLYAAQKADSQIARGHPQRDELERKQQQYEQDFNSTVLNLFDKVYFPRQSPGSGAVLASKPLDMTRGTDKPFSGEEQIEKTLTAQPLKLYTDMETAYDAIREKAQDLLWPEGQDEARRQDVVDGLAEQPGMPWLPPRGFDEINTKACNEGKWEDLGNGYITKKPKKKKTSVQVTRESGPDDDGTVTLRVTPTNAGPAPRIHYATDGPVSEASPLLNDDQLRTSALRVRFLVVDPNHQHETGDPITWKNEIKVRNELVEEGGKRKVKLMAAPRGTLRYTLDGSEPRNGIAYEGAVEIGDARTTLLVFAEAEGLEARADFTFEKRGTTGPVIDPVKPGRLETTRGPKKLDSRTKTFDALGLAAEKKVTFSSVIVTIGQGDKAVMVHLGAQIEATADYIQTLLTSALTGFTPNEAVTMTFQQAQFATGFDMQQFCERMGIVINQGEVKQ